jgi:hypothetical protein
MAIFTALFFVVRHYRRATGHLRKPMTPITPALPLQVNPDIEAGKFSPVPLTPAITEKFGPRPPGDGVPFPIIMTTLASEAVPPPLRSGVPRDDQVGVVSLSFLRCARTDVASNSHQQALLVLPEDHRC